MKPLDVRFRETTDLKLSDIAKESGMRKSDIARIAMMRGINSLTEELNEGAKEYWKIEALKAKQ